MDNKVPIPRFMNEAELQKANLMKWLKSSSQYYDQYSDYYTSFFSVNDPNNILYTKGDLDDKLNTMPINDLYDESSPEKSYVDHANIDGERKDIYIPPETNQSNANYFYKLLVRSSLDLNPYHIPVVPDNLRTSFNGSIQKVPMQIDKTQTYTFVYNASK